MGLPLHRAISAEFYRLTEVTTIPIFVCPQDGSSVSTGCLRSRRREVLSRAESSREDIQSPGHKLNLQGFRV